KRRRLRRDIGTGRPSPVGRRCRPQHHHGIPSRGIERSRTPPAVRSSPMMRWFRRLFLLSVLVGAGLGGYQVWNRRRTASAPTPEWPPLRSETPTPETVRPAATATTTTEAATWVAPVD